MEKTTKNKIAQFQSVDLIVKNLKMNKISKGTQIMMDNENLHALEAIQCGVYITWSSQSEMACFRIGSNSVCICTHGFLQHEKIVTRKKFSTKCLDCKCRAFNYIPTLPEEIGEYWIPYQPKFDYSKWKAKCKCKHGWNEHSVEKFMKCNACTCFNFNSNFCCVVCDKFWQDHHMNYELEHDRLMLKKPIGNDFIPFAELPQMYNILYKK